MRLAVTGGIAEGKSTVLQAIQEAGVQVASADEIAREVFALNEVQVGLERILGIPAPIEPESLKQSIFSSLDVRRAVNRLMHPIIVQRIETIQAPVIEVPLLFESCLQGSFERVWVVSCGPDEQLRRLAQRTGNVEEARQMIKAQLPSCVRFAFADRIVRTNLEPDTVRLYVFDSIRQDLGISLARS